MACQRAHQTPIEQILSQPESPACVEFLSHCEACAECAAELAGHRRRSHRGGSKGLALGLAAGAIAVAMMFLWGDEPEPAPLAAPAPAAIEHDPEPASVESVPEPEARDPKAVAELVSGKKQAISLAKHPAEQPVRLTLRLPVPSASDATRPIRVVSSSGELLEIDGALNEERTAASFEVPRSFLSPGRYMIEGKTTEKSHLRIK